MHLDMVVSLTCFINVCGTFFVSDFDGAFMMMAGEYLEMTAVFVGMFHGHGYRYLVLDNLSHLAFG